MSILRISSSLNDSASCNSHNSFLECNHLLPKHKEDNRNTQDENENHHNEENSSATTLNTTDFSPQTYSKDCISLSSDSSLKLSDHPKNVYNQHERSQKTSEQEELLTTEYVSFDPRGYNGGRCVSPADEIEPPSLLSQSLCRQNIFYKIFENFDLEKQVTLISNKFKGLAFGSFLNKIMKFLFNCILRRNNITYQTVDAEQYIPYRNETEDDSNIIPSFSPPQFDHDDNHCLEHKPITKIISNPNIIKNQWILRIAMKKNKFNFFSSSSSSSSTLKASPNKHLHNLSVAEYFQFSVPGAPINENTPLLEGTKKYDLLNLFNNNPTANNNSTNFHIDSYTNRNDSIDDKNIINNGYNNNGNYLSQIFFKKQELRSSPNHYLQPSGKTQNLCNLIVDKDEEIIRKGICLAIEELGENEWMKIFLLPCHEISLRERKVLGGIMAMSQFYGLDKGLSIELNNYDTKVAQLLRDMVQLYGMEHVLEGKFRNTLNPFSV